MPAVTQHLEPSLGSHLAPCRIFKIPTVGTARTATPVREAVSEPSQAHFSTCTRAELWQRQSDCAAEDANRLALHTRCRWTLAYTRRAGLPCLCSVSPGESLTSPHCSSHRYCLQAQIPLHTLIQPLAKRGPLCELCIQPVGPWGSLRCWSGWGCRGSWHRG